MRQVADFCAALWPEFAPTLTTIAPDSIGGIREIDGKSYMEDPKGALIPLDLVKPIDQLRDQTVRQLIAHAHALADQIARFRGQCFDDLGLFWALIADKYGAKDLGGNVTLTSFDGCYKVQFQVADRLNFTPDLQEAKSLIDVCLSQLAADTNNKARAIVNRAFDLDDEGKISHAQLIMLTRIDIDDERCQRALDIVRESVRTIGSMGHVRFYNRPHSKAKWQVIAADLERPDQSLGHGASPKSIPTSF